VSEEHRITLRRRIHTELVAKLSYRYTINTSAARDQHP